MRCKTLWLLAGLALPAVSPGAPTLTHHEIRAEITPRRSYLEVVDQFRVEGIETSTVRFLLHKALAVSSLRMGDRELGWRELTLERSHWPGVGEEALEMWCEAREIEVNLPGDREELVELTIHFEGVVYDSLTPPTAPYARSFESTSGLIDRRGAYLAGGTTWIPTMPGALFSFLLETVVPIDWESVSQGEMEVRIDQGARRMTRWLCGEPMEEVYLIAGPYTYREANHGEIKLLGFLYEAEDAQELWGRYLDVTRKYIDRYSVEIGPYPYPKFALVENFWPTGYGMPSFTLLGSDVIRLPFIPYTSYRHEILHNWWGNGVYVAWDEGNWCEGLTSYGADHAYREDRSPEQAAAYRRGELRKYRNYVKGEKDFPLVEFRSRSSASTQAVGYSKATMLLHMLRKTIGEIPFRTGLKEFYKERKFQVSSWKDLEESFEKTSGEDLSVFFEQWTQRKGAPAITLDEVSWETSNKGSFSVEGVLRQEKPHYQLDVPLRIETGSGDEEIVVILDKGESKFRWEGSSRPLTVSVDPAFDIFRKLYREEIPPSLSQTLGSDSTLILLPDDASPDERGALEGLARSWASSDAVTVTTGPVPEEALPSHALWLLGETSFLDRFVEQLPSDVVVANGSWTIMGREFSSREHSFVLTISNPANPELSWTLFLPQSAEVIEILGRKIPHYGKYGYLVFAETENILKGEWPSPESPLRVRLGS